MRKKDIQSGQETVDLSASQAERSDIAKILQTFSTSASMHGLRKITEVQYTPFRIIWILAIITCSGVFIAQICKHGHLYNEYNKKTILSVSYDSITFPDVTICNHRHVDVDILHSLFSQYHLNENPTELYHMKNLTRARPELEIEVMKRQSEYTKTAEYYQNQFSNYTWLTTQAFERTIFWSVLNLTYSAGNTLAPPVEELVPVCQWEDQECPPEYLEIHDNYFRKCVTLRPPKGTQIQEGIENGLSVISLVVSGMLPFSDIIQNYMVQIPGLSDPSHPLAGADGLRVVVHQRGTPPLPMSEGFTIPPGYLGSLGIKVNRYKRIEARYGNCIKTDPYSDNQHDGYRLSVCIQRCIQNHTIATCNCSSPTLPPHSQYSYPNLSCNIVQPIPENCQGNKPPLHCLSPFKNLAKNLDCAKRVKRMILAEQDIMGYCMCYPACDEDAYNIGFSLGAWPSLMETDIIWQNILEPKMQHFISNLNYSDTKKQLFRNHFTLSNRYKAMQDFVKLNVYLSDAAVQETTEKADYVLIDLMADIGGAMGLWVGMSILSMMEIVQLLLDVLRSLCKRKAVNKVTTG